jgi:hypothetical protein
LQHGPVSIAVARAGRIGPAAASPLERRMYGSAVDDDDVFHVFERIGSRRRSPATLFAPRMLARLARAPG